MKEEERKEKHKGEEGKGRITIQTFHITTQAIPATKTFISSHRLPAVDFPLKTTGSTFNFVLICFGLPMSGTQIVLASSPQPIQTESSDVSSQGLRVLCWNICVPPWGKLNIGPSGVCVCSDQKRMRIKLMFDHVFAKYDILLLHEVWGAWYSWYQTAFLKEAKRHGFRYVAKDNSSYCCKLTDNGCV